MKCKVESINSLDMTVWMSTPTGGSVLVEMDTEMMDVLMDAALKGGYVNLEYSAGEFDIKAVASGEEAHVSSVVPEQVKPLSRRALASKGGKLVTLSAILVDHGIIPDDLPTLRKSSIVSSFVMPALEATGVMTPIHERVDNHGERRKVRYFTHTGGRYGFTKKFLLDASGKKTISRNHVFYSHKADELIKLIGDDAIEKIKESCQ